MASKLSKRFLILCSTLATAGGCGQILGISDYDVDPKLDRDASSSAGGQGGSGDSPGTGSSGETTTGGKLSTGGRGGMASTAGTSNGGEPPVSQGGAGGEPPVVGTGGEPPVVGTGGAAAGESGVGGAGGEGGAPLGEVVACDSADCCKALGGTAVGVEMLKDGGFELGTAVDGLTPWTETSSNDLPLITDGVEEKTTAHRGTYLAFLAGVTDETSVLESEALEVPTDAGWMVLSGYRKFQLDSKADDLLNEDSMSFSLWDASDLLELPFYWDNTDPGATLGWVKFEASWDAAPHQGGTRYLDALGFTDSYVTDADLTSTNYMIDDVSLKVFRCYE